MRRSDIGGASRAAKEGGVTSSVFSTRGILSLLALLFLLTVHHALQDWYVEDSCASVAAAAASTMRGRSASGADAPAPAMAAAAPAPAPVSCLPAPALPCVPKTSPSSGTPPTPPAPPTPGLVQSLADGGRCHLPELTANGKPFTVTHHAAISPDQALASAVQSSATAAVQAAASKPSPEWWMAAYGDADYITSRSKPGSDTFFEEGSARFFVRTLRTARAARAAANDARPVWFLDVGANIGVHALAVAAAGFPTVAVEGSPPTAARLRCSKLMNSFEHLVVVHAAIAAQEGPVCFAERDVNNAGMNWLDAGKSDAAAAAACPATHAAPGLPMAVLAARQLGPSAPGPTLIKVDIEGSELVFLQSLEPLLRSGVPGGGEPWRPEAMMMELRPELLGTRGADVQAIITFVKGHGYRSFFADMGGEELTKAVGMSQKDAYELVHGKRTCPNYVFVREDLDPANYKNHFGCDE
jgi:FkbM family methyltransferase